MFHIDYSNTSGEQEGEAEEKLRAFLSHPLTTAVAGSAASAVLGKP
jgi:hypothetical protein